MNQLMQQKILKNNSKQTEKLLKYHIVMLNKIYITSKEHIIAIKWYTEVVSTEDLLFFLLFRPSK